MNYSILTEVTADLPLSYINENKIGLLPTNCTIDGCEYDGIEKVMDLKEFYLMLRNAVMAKTSQNSPEVIKEHYIQYLEKGIDILHIAFSSGLSGNYQSATIAADDLKEKFPDRKIIVIDSKCASLGQGLLVDYAVNQKKEGVSLEELAQKVEDKIQKVCHYFTVDDLNHLYRGGRVSKASAVFGTLLGIKPSLHVNEEGRLIPIGKVRGRRQSLETLVSNMAKKIDLKENKYVFISHGDCLDDAKYVEKLVKEKFNLPSKIINTIGTVIGAHSGPGTVALFFMGTDRAEKPL